jgi:hypothetical protein
MPLNNDVDENISPDFSKIPSINDLATEVSEKNQILGNLENCQEPIFDKKIPSQKWNYSELSAIFILLIVLALSVFIVYFFDSYIPAIITENKKAEELKIRKPENLIWKEVPGVTPWEKRDSHTTYIFKNKIYLTGGLDANKAISADGQPNYDLAVYFNDIWVSDDGAKWTLAKEHAAFPPIRSASIVEFNGKLFMYGGYTPKNTYHNGIWTSNDGVNWKQITPNSPWEEREGQKVLEYQGKLWFFGGVSYYGHKTFNDVWNSDDGINWKQVAKSSPWLPRWDFDAIVWNNEIWFMGGMDRGLIGYGDIWKTSDGVHWTAMGEMPIGKKQGLELGILDNVLYINGGLDAKTNEGYLDTWYTKDGVNWQKTLTPNKFLSREDHELVMFNNRIWFFGGMNSSWRWNNDIWYSDFQLPEATTTISHLITTEDIEKVGITSKNLISLKVGTDGKIVEVAGLNTKDKRPIASVTKLMTGLITHENKDPSEKITITSEIYKQFAMPTTVVLNKTYTIGELLKTLLINSNNNAAIALMNSFENNEFIDLMNKKAAEIGMVDTTYGNPTGLDSRTNMNYSTAYDLSLLANYVLKNHPDLLKITTNANETFCSITNDDCKQIQSTDLLLNDPEIAPTIVGGKTGDTDLAKLNLILITKTDKVGEYLINVILGSDDHFSDMKKLLTLLKVKL